uniref:Uncharacterized protein n=1 Tax=Aegilops tauschii TaxID=37682 RepID=R7W2D1_AEGTA
MKGTAAAGGSSRLGRSGRCGQGRRLGQARQLGKSERWHEFTDSRFSYTLAICLRPLLNFHARRFLGVWCFDLVPVVSVYGEAASSRGQRSGCCGRQSSRSKELEMVQVERLQRLLNWIEVPYDSIAKEHQRQALFSDYKVVQCWLTLYMCDT